MLHIGVICPTYNQSTWIRAALASYFAQTYPSTLVVVDDASDDDTPRILASHEPKVDVLRHTKNKGTAEAINSGVDVLPKALDALTWISSDNVMATDWLETLADCMEKHGAGAVYGGFWYLKPAPAKPLYLFTKYSRDKLINSPLNCFFGPAFLIRRDVWIEAGPHRGKITHDFDHWLRIEEICLKRNLPILGVDKALCWYNAHDERVTVTRRHEFDAFKWQEEAKKRRAHESSI